MDSKLKVGIAGCGRIAQVYLEALRAINGVALIAACDEDENKVKPVMELFGCRGYMFIEELFGSEDLDCMIVCTPPVFHYGICKIALNKNVAVLCEKPLALSIVEAEELIENAEGKGRVFMLASKFRFVEDVIRAKSIVESGLLGEILYYENTFTSVVDMKHRWNSKKEISGGGVWIDNGSHSVDLLRYLLGPIKSISAQRARRIQDLEVEDSISVSIITESGTLGTIDLSWSIKKEIDHYLSLYGTEGSLFIGWTKSWYSLKNKSNQVTFGNGYNKFAAFHRQMQHFFNCLRGKEKPLITADDELATIHVVNLGYESMKENSWIQIEPK